MCARARGARSLLTGRHPWAPGTLGAGRAEGRLTALAGAVVGASPTAAASPAPFALGAVVGEARPPSLSSLSPLRATDCHWLRVSAFPRVTSLACDARANTHAWDIA